MLGMWWLPEQPDQTVAGSLDVSDQDRWKLLVYSSLDGPSTHADITKVLCRPTIWGRTSNDDRISLFDALRTSASVAFPSRLTPEDWSFSGYSIGNTHVDSKTIVKKLHVELDGLADWNWNVDQERYYDGKNQRIKIPRPWRDSVEIADATVALQSQWRPILSPSSFQMSCQASFEIDLQCEVAELFETWVFPLQNLLSFFALDYVGVSSVAAQLVDQQQSVQVYRRVVMPTAKTQSPLQSSKILATPRQLIDIGVGFDALLQRWFGLRESHGYALNLMSAQHSTPFLHSETQLLLACIAMERYHTVAIGGTALSEEDYAQRVHAVLESTPIEHKEWLRVQLDNRNQKGQLRVLSEVLERGEGTARKIESVWPKFAKFVNHQRNRAAHARKRADARDGLQFVAAATGLLWVLRHVYLVELGISTDNATQLLDGCQQFQQELRCLREWRAE